VAATAVTVVAEMAVAAARANESMAMRRRRDMEFPLVTCERRPRCGHDPDSSTPSRRELTPPTVGRSFAQ
jgi:hypothetical protein